MGSTAASKPTRGPSPPRERHPDTVGSTAGSKPTPGNPQSAPASGGVKDPARRHDTTAPQVCRIPLGCPAVMNLSTPTPPRLGLVLATLGTAALIAGCGSSGGSSTITLGNESAASSSVVEHTTTPTTPTSGPLATEPTITPPKTPAPKTLVIKEVVKGTGAEAKAGESVTVNYVGALYSNGKVFDASWKRKEPFTFTLGQGQVIPGWDKGVAGMRVGGRRELIIPAELAYGKQGSPPKIPPNSPLIFTVDLLSA
jgi:peptidylprolyl isomerase